MKKSKQKGAVLIIFVIIFVLVIMVYLLKIVGSGALQTARVDKSTEILTQAKQALISYSISRAGAGERPGDMPLPDRLLSPIETPPVGGSPNYDGATDSCTNTGTVAMNCLGRLPWQTIGLAFPNPSQNDTAGSMPWYAVSANLVDPTCLAVLNTNTLNLVNNPPPAPMDCSGLALPYPWLTVIDSVGHVLSNQVAAVIMLPGIILPGQARPVAPLGGVTNYLEAVTIPVGCVGTCVPAGLYSNADSDNIFVVPPPFTTGSTSNDRLVYITKEELIREVERRATQEAATQLKRYYTNSNAIAANRFYPYAANLGDANNACENTNLAGLIPIAAYANCTSASTCATNFPITRVDFTLTSAVSFASRTGSCSIVAGACRCTGAGDCRRGVRRFTCTASGNGFGCQSTGAGSAGVFSFTYTPKTPDVTVTSSSCTKGIAGVVNCVGGAGAFSSPPTTCTHENPSISTLPVWFTGNNWQNLIYYAISNNCNSVTPGCQIGGLIVGGRNNVDAVVISSGVTLNPSERGITQVRPSGDFTRYLDGLITDGNTTFDATSKIQTDNYNDQPLIVAP